MAKAQKELYVAQPKQLLFHNATAEEILYGGAAGGGKSKAILWDSVALALRYKNIRIGVFRRTFPELEKSLIFNFLKEVPNHLYDYSKKEHRAYFKDTGSVVEFNHVQYESDVYKYQSVEYDFLYFDELTHFTEFIYQYLLSRLRKSNNDNPKLKPQVKSGSNPGNVGHLWVKKRFIDDAEPYEVINRVMETEDIISTFTSQFIPATLYDNQILMKADPAYESRLKRLPEDERKALLDGNWEAFKGQFFKEWDMAKHVCNEFEIPRDWKRFRAMDWGYTAPTCVLWFAISPDKRIYVYRELYVSKTNISEIAQMIKEMSIYGDDRVSQEDISYTVADPSLWSVTQFEQGESIAMRLMEYGVMLMKADNNRYSGWSALHDVLYYDRDDPKSLPKLQIFKECRNLIRTLPAQVHDDHKPEDLDTTNEDHAVDALRYGIMSNPQVARLKNKVYVANNTFEAHFQKARKSKQLVYYVGGR